MISTDPLNSLAERSSSMSITCEREVPNTASCRNDELGATNNEGINPECTEQVVDKEVSNLRSPNNRCHKLERRSSRLNLPNRSNINCSDSPRSHPNDAHNQDNGR